MVCLESWCILVNGQGESYQYCGTVTNAETPTKSHDHIYLTSSPVSKKADSSPWGWSLKKQLFRSPMWSRNSNGKRRWFSMLILMVLYSSLNIWIYKTFYLYSCEASQMPFQSLALQKCQWSAPHVRPQCWKKSRIWSWTHYVLKSHWTCNCCHSFCCIEQPVCLSKVSAKWKCNRPRLQAPLNL